MWYSRLSKLVASSVCKRVTYKYHPTLNQKASFSGLSSFKSPTISSRYGYTNYPNNLYLVKHYHNYGVQQKLISSPEGVLVFLKRITYLLSSALIGVLIFGVYELSEKIPYTNRTHIVVAPPIWDKMYGDAIFEDVRLSIPEHPDSVGVKMIGEQIVEALESDLKAMKNENVSASHLVGLKWEFVVVDNPVVDSSSLPGGKIFISTGLLKKLESDADVATIIAHEVAHNVARHRTNRMNMLLLAIHIRAFFGLAKSKAKMIDHHPHGVSKWIRVLFQYPMWRRQESEADHIGLLVMASAGYDPQAAPKVYEIFEKKPSSGSDFYDMCPSGKKRAEKLAKGKVMKEASSIYSKVIGTRKMNDLEDR